MSVLQSTQPELRYLKRQNLKQEANIVGNWYRDIIRSYGIDVTYNKLDTSFFDDFHGTVDKNAIIRQAYGYNTQPDYSVSAHMLSYMEVENDIFQLNKFGLNPETTVNFYFDSTDFACDLACKLGQYQEVKIDETEIVCEVPDMTDEQIDGTYVSSATFPYELGLGYVEKFFCKDLSGKLYAQIDSYEYDAPKTVQCRVYEHSEMMRAFSANPSLYKAFKHQYQNDSYIDSMLKLTFTVHKTCTGKDAHGKKIFKSILSGKLHGSMLFYDLNKVGKYIDKIHPEVGDLVTIDFPDDSNLEKYEITDCFDKQLTNDGISPLLHKYIWKCKARRYVNNFDDVEQNEADSRLEEKVKLDNAIENKVKEAVELYTDGQDAVYGGYSNRNTEHDMMHIDQTKYEKYDWIEDGSAIDIMRFANGTRLVTTGYELLFVDSKMQATKIATEDDPILIDIGSYSEHGMKWLKASKDTLVFTNIEGKSYKIVEDFEVTDGQLTLQLDNLFEKTSNVGEINKYSDNFYKFRNCRTLLFSDNDILYCKLESNGKTYQLS